MSRLVLGRTANQIWHACENDGRSGLIQSIENRERKACNGRVEDLNSCGRTVEESLVLH